MRDEAGDQPDLAAALRSIDNGLNELWFMIFQCAAVAEATGNACESMGVAPLTPAEIDTVHGLTGATRTLAGWAADKAGELQRQLEQALAGRRRAG